MVVSKRKKKELPIRPLRICSKMSWKVFHPPFSDTFTSSLSPLKEFNSKKKYGKLEINISPPNIIAVSPLIGTLPLQRKTNNPRLPAATTPQSPPLSAVRRSLVAGLGLHQLRGSDASTWCLKESDVVDPTGLGWRWLGWGRWGQDIPLSCLEAAFNNDQWENFYQPRWWCRWGWITSSVFFGCSQNHLANSACFAFCFVCSRIFGGMEVFFLSFKTWPVVVLGIILGVFVPPRKTRKTMCA